MRGAAPRPPAHATLNRALRAAAAEPGGLTFVDLQERERLYAWGELYARARRVAGALGERGVAPGDRVALVLGTGIDFVDGFFGALLAGATPVPLAPPLRLGRLDEFHAASARMLTRAGARLVLTDARIQRLLGVAIERARPPLGCALVGPLLASTLEQDCEVGPDSLAVVQFSSGSTVDPKPVALTQRNLVWQLAAIAQALPAPEEQTDGRNVGVSWLPLHHDMGLIGVLLSGVYQPASLALLPSEIFLARPSLWLRAIGRHRATVSPAPSFAYSLALARVRDGELDGVDLSSWRYALNGAEPVAVGVLDAFAARFGRWGFDPCALVPVYGLAEATLAVTFAPPGRPPYAIAVDAGRLARDGVALPSEAPDARRLASVGTPVPGVAIAVRDDERRPLPDGRVGRIWVQGPSVMRGYLGDDAASARTLVDDWLDTGDLGFVADGELFVCGRAKDVVIIRGANHAPQEFEECLDGVAGLRVGCAVALGFTPAGGEEALLILAERAGDAGASAGGDEALVARVRAAILERTGVRAHTVQLLAPGTLPRTTSGKLRRAEALRRFLAGELSAPRPVSPLALAGAFLRSALAFARLRVSGAR